MTGADAIIVVERLHERAQSLLFAIQRGTDLRAISRQNAVVDTLADVLLCLRQYEQAEDPALLADAQALLRGEDV